MPGAFRRGLCHQEGEGKWRFWFFLSDNPEVEPIVMEKERNHNPHHRAGDLVVNQWVKQAKMLSFHQRMKNASP